MQNKTKQKKARATKKRRKKEEKMKKQGRLSKWIDVEVRMGGLGIR